MSGTILMCFLVIYCNFVFLQVSGEKLTAERLQEYYSHSRPGEMVCYYHGMICRRDSQVCSPVSRGCEDVKLFDDNMSEDEKCLACREYLEGINVTTKQDPSETFGYPDVCLYRIGQAVQNNIACGTLSRMKKDVPDVTQDTCLLPDSDDVEDCERGKGYCNATGCQPLFPNHIKTDEEKSEYCKHVNKSNTQKYDSCVYALGLIALNEEGKADESDQRPQDDNTRDIVIAVLVIVIILVVVAIIIGVLVCCYRRQTCIWAEREQNNGTQEGEELRPMNAPDDKTITTRSRRLPSPLE